MRPRLLALVSLSCFSTLAWSTEPVRFDYMMNCQGCHLPEGQGFPARDVPEIRGNMGKFLYVDGGREFLVQVPGSAQSDLDSKRLAALLNWMLETFSPDELPNDFRRYSSDEVERLRQSPLTEVKELRQALIGQIRAYEAALGREL